MDNKSTNTERRRHFLSVEQIVVENVLQKLNTIRQDKLGPTYLFSAFDIKSLGNFIDRVISEGLPDINYKNPHKN